MSRTPKIDRARRNALKSAGLIFGAVLAAGAPHKQASAQSQPVRDGADSILGILRDILRDVLGVKKPGPGDTTRPDTNKRCFAQGTLIRTREGYRPIETLAAGDEVAVRSGGFAPIKAMISHTLNSVSGKWADESNLPVLMRRGALGENSPSADLCLTAWHPVYVDGFLTPTGDLVNGTSITFEAAGGRDKLDFFNIELDRHDILDVQGAFCESLARAETVRCAPLLRLAGVRSQLRSRMRSVASIVVDRRQPIDIIRDKLEERGLELARAA